MDKSCYNGDAAKPSGLVPGQVEYRAVSCACRCRFCRKCSVAMGLKLQKRLLTSSRVAEFANPLMVTLTIDPELFASDVEAYEYCREKRVISRLVASLRDRGLVDSAHYFASVEYHKSGRHHYHLLVDAKRIDHGLLMDLWGRFRPVDRPRDPDRPAFGFVFLSKPKGAGVRSAILYATKYVLKEPPEGWPDWVMEYRGNVPRYQCSRGVWLDTEPTPPPQADTFDPDPRPDDDDEAEPDDQRPTIADRVASCRTRAVIVRLEMLPDGSVATHYLGDCPIGFADVRDRHGRGRDDPANFVSLRPDVADYLLGFSYANRKQDSGGCRRPGRPRSQGRDGPDG